MQSARARKARLVPTDMWQSAIASGKVMLLSSEQSKLGRIYRGLNNHNFDSKKIWNVSVIAKTTGTNMWGGGFLSLSSC